MVSDIGVILLGFDVGVLMLIFVYMVSILKEKNPK